MNKRLINLAKYVFFLALGAWIFWKLYRDFDFANIKEVIFEIKYFWIFASIFFAILSQVSRAIRWKMLMKPLGFNPKFSNTFLSVFVMYMFNIFIPRGGEVARCSVLASTDNVPFTKLVGTVIVERLADFLMLIILAVIIFVINIDMVYLFFDKHHDLIEGLKAQINAKNVILASLAFIALIALLWFVVQRFLRRYTKVQSLWQKIVEGIKSISQLKNKWSFIGHTIFIYMMWLAMLYVVFLAYEPTEHLTVRVGTVTFLMGGLAMVLPINAGMGAWHFMIIETLLLYGIDYDSSKNFALIAHTTTNLVYIVLGAVALVILYIINGKKLDPFQPKKRDESAEQVL